MTTRDVHFFGDGCVPQFEPQTSQVEAETDEAPEDGAFVPYIPQPEVDDIGVTVTVPRGRSVSMKFKLDISAEGEF